MSGNLVKAWIKVVAPAHHAAVWMMPERCVVYGCSNVADRERGLSLHRIPFWNDERPEAKERKEKWIDFVRKHRAEWIPSRQSVICSKHFLAEHFDRMFLSLPGFSKQFIPRLKRDEIGINAIPMIDPPLPDSIKIVDTVQTDSGVESGGSKRYVSRQRKKVCLQCFCP